MSGARREAPPPPALQGEEWDVLVIGGGIVGAGVARDAALRGWRTALVEQADFASGTSSRSSRLLHGGLRYLAQGRLGLVRQASIEKRVVHAIAPHLVEPCPLLFPAYRHAGPALWRLRAGVTLYDLLCGGANFGRSHALTPAAMRARLPGAAPGLAGGVRYFDGFTNDARLVLDTLRSAARAGAVVANYTPCVRAHPHGRGWRVVVRAGAAGAERTLQARTVVNATGPWGDRLPASTVRLRGTKGVHLVFDRAQLPVPEAVVLTEGERLLFVLPWGERVIVGTTDTDHHGPPEHAAVTPADVDYLLVALARHFPGWRVDTGAIRSSWAGVRPLLADRRGRPSDLSRAHWIRESQPGWWDVAGGKLTTYRRMAEETTDRIAARLGRREPSRTAHEPLLADAAQARWSSLLPPPVERAAVEHFCRAEWARHLTDVVERRTSWRHYRPDFPLVARRVAGWMGELLGWTPEEERAELAAVLRPAANPPAMQAFPAPQIG